MDNTSLNKRAKKGYLWSLLGKFSDYIIRFALGVFLARILSPAEFGLVGMLTVFFVIATVFIQSGFGNALIQKKNATEEDKNTLFYFNLAISIILYFILFYFAPKIALFYNEPQLTKLTRVLGVVLIINSFSIIQHVQLRKKINYKKITIVNSISSLSSGIIGIVFAYKGLGVWSLVIQRLLFSFFWSVGLWLINKWVPSFIFRFKSLKEVFSYSSHIFLTALIQRTFENIYLLAIGKFYNATVLGFYSRAKTMQVLFSDNLSRAIGDVSFATFSKVQDNKDKLIYGLSMQLSTLSFLAIPFLLGLIAIAKPFFIVLLTDKWLPSVPYFKLLCIVGIFSVLNFTNRSILNAIGDSKSNFRIELVKNILRIINIILFLKLDIIYLILGEIFISVISFVLVSLIMNKHLKYGLHKQLKDILPALIIGSFTFLAIRFINISTENVYLEFFYKIGIGSFVFLFTSVLFAKNKLKMFLKIFSKI